MRIAYLDCPSGISGDMTLAALVDAGVELAAIQSGIDSLGLPQCRLVASEVRKKGFRACQIVVEHAAEKTHRHLYHITAMIDQSRLTAAQKELAKNIFTRLGEAEAKVHGTTIEKVHFHEIGAVDSIADIVGAAIGWKLLGAERLVVSPVPTGGGTVQIAHGRCSVPTPATAELLKGIPLASSSIEAELTTPTGAAIVSTLADDFGPLPAMRIEKIGYGAGQRELETQANLVRLIVGQTTDATAVDQVWIVETNLDDISGELIGYCTGKLWEAGALEVTTTAIQMKKNRPGVTLSVQCRAAELEAIENVLFRETTTFGVRRWPVSRHKLKRTAHRVQTPFGPIDGQVGHLGGGQKTFAPEFESCRQVAQQQGVALKAVYEAAQKAFDQGWE